MQNEQLMEFKDMKSGYAVHFFDKEAVKVYVGKVVSVAVPRYDAPAFGQMPSKPQGMVVDVTIEADGVAKTYTIPESSSVAYAGCLVLCTDKADIVREVEALKAASEDALGQMERHRDVVVRCSAVLEELNPAIAERKAQDKRIEGIEHEVKSLGRLVRDFIDEFKK